MDKGQVVEQGDHESLMRNAGVYHALVEQQNLRRSEEEEQLAFERQESTGLILASHTEDKPSSVERIRSSTLVSLTPSTMAALYGKKNDDINNDEHGTDGATKKKKVIDTHDEKNNS
jgi:hypothetical protein